MTGFEDYYHHVDVEALPAGYRFKPTDEELVRYYLMKKVANQPLPNVTIPETDVYSDNPKNLAGSHKELMENHWFFFSTRDRKYANGNRPRRDAGDGFWKATGSSELVYIQGVRKAEKRSLVYFMQVPGNPDKKKKTDWLMHEYKLIDSSHQRTSENDMRLDDVVLYKIYKKKNANRGDIVQPEMIPGESAAPPPPPRPFSSDNSSNNYHEASMQNNAFSGGDRFQILPVSRQEEAPAPPPQPFDSNNNYLACVGGQPSGHEASMQDNAFSGGDRFQILPVSRQQESPAPPPQPFHSNNNYLAYGGGDLQPSGHEASMQNNAFSGGDRFQILPVSGQQEAPAPPPHPFDCNNYLAYGGGDLQPLSGGDRFQILPVSRQQEAPAPPPPPFDSNNYLAYGGGDLQPSGHHQACMQNNAVAYSGECFQFPPVLREDSMLPPLHSVTEYHAYYGGTSMQPLAAIRPEPGDAIYGEGCFQLAPDQAVMINNSYGGGRGGPQQQLSGAGEMLMTDDWYEYPSLDQAVMMMNDSIRRGGPQLGEVNYFSTDEHELLDFGPAAAPLRQH